MVEENSLNDAQMLLLEWLDAHEEKQEQLHTGQILDGTVMRASPDEILIDVGAKAEGVVDSRELSQLSEEERASLQEGAVLRVYVVRPEGDDGNPQLSIVRARIEQDWEEVEAHHEADEIFEATVTGSNKGGLIVHVGQLRAFVPASQVFSLRGQRREGQSHRDQLAGLIGESLKFKVLEMDRDQNRLILSERAAEQEQRKALKANLLEEIDVGQTRTGTVASLAPFGAFVDLGGADGLIHISELSWGRVGHPSEVVRVGDEIEVHVLNVDHERQRIGLSLKKLQPEPWTAFMEAYNEGDEIEVTITNLTDFGAFARVSTHPIEGLIHISELSDNHVSHPSELLLSGDKVNARILRMEPNRQRLGLSLRGLSTDESEESDPVVEDELGYADDGEGADNPGDADEALLAYDADEAEEADLTEASDDRDTLDASDESEALTIETDYAMDEAS